MYIAYKDILDNEYDLYSRLFASSLPLPVTVRVYPNATEFYNLNPLAHTVVTGGTHSHVGFREIALIGDTIAANPLEWMGEAVNAFRFELAQLFVEQITGLKAPPGLLDGIGLFAQDPTETIGTIIPTEDVPLDKSWESILAKDANEPLKKVEAVSIVAFLIDVYTWPTFLRSIQELRTAESYARVLPYLYKNDLAALQSEWETYYSFYVRGRWKAHIVYNYDLSVSEKLIQAGDYADAIQALQESIAFLIQIGLQEDKLKTAQNMLGVATTGQEAKNFLLQARQALQEKNYVSCLNLVDQSRQKYNLVADTRHLSELDSYQKRAQDVLAVRSELDDLQASVQPGQLDAATANQLLVISTRLGELGDTEGQERARKIAYSIESGMLGNQDADLLKIAIEVTVLIIVLLGLRFWLLRHKPPKEARL